MKLSENTKKIFENFSTINESLLILEGSKQKTMNINRTFLADAVVDETFPVECGIYNLPKFLSLLSMFNDPELEFGDKVVTVREGSRSARFAYCDAKLIKSPPKGRDLALANVSVAFTLSETVLSQIQKAAKILGVPDLVLSANGENLILSVKSNKDSSADTFTEVVGESTEEFSYSFDIESLKFIPGGYDVEIEGKADGKGLAKFTSKSQNLVYWIPTQS